MENEFLTNGQEDADKEHKKVQEIPNATEKALFTCA